MYVKIYLGSTLDYSNALNGYQFAIAEECQLLQEEFGECDTYTDVYGNNVIEIEYTVSNSSLIDAPCICLQDVG